MHGRRSTTTKRNLSIVACCCSLLLLAIVEFRYSISTTVLGNARTAETTVATNQSDVDAAEFDELLGRVAPSSSHNRASLSRFSSRLRKHKHAGPKPTTFDTHDRKIGAAKINWESNREIPLTSLVRHSPGFTILDNVYLLNGTLYVVRSDATPATFPAPNAMLSNGRKGEPTDDNLSVISASQAFSLFGTHASRLEGTSFLTYDDDSALTDHYHFNAELLFTLWRTYSSLDTRISPTGTTSLAQPRRFIAPNIPSTRWRDYASLNQYVLHAAFPSTGLEFAGDWKDRSETLRPYFLDRIVLGDKTAAQRGMDTPAVQADKFPKSPHWWTPLRNNVVAFAGGSHPGGKKRHSSSQPVITYVHRQQWGKRMLRGGDHDRLVSRLHDVGAKKGWEVNVVSMENLSREEQIQLAARTNVLLGVHGAGLTSLLWMEDKSATVVEFFAPGAYSEDFEVMARMVGVKHFVVWDDRTMTYPSLPVKANLPSHGDTPEFDSNQIPLNVDVVMDLVVKQLESDGSS